MNEIIIFTLFSIIGVSSSLVFYVIASTQIKKKYTPISCLDTGNSSKVKSFVMLPKEEQIYRDFFKDVSHITRSYVLENNSNSYPKMKPAFRGYLVRELQRLGYSK